MVPLPIFPVIRRSWVISSPISCDNEASSVFQNSDLALWIAAGSNGVFGMYRSVKRRERAIQPWPRVLISVVRDSSPRQIWSVPPLRRRSTEDVSHPCDERFSNDKIWEKGWEPSQATCRPLSVDSSKERWKQKVS